jgi:hypothetical protein
MARPKGNTVTVMEDTSIDRVIAAAVSQLLVVAPPWVLAVLAVIASAVFHKLWGAHLWASFGLLPPTILLTVLAWLTAHSRGWLGRAHITATPAAVGVWMAFATAAGPFDAGLMAYTTVIGWGTLALTWNLRRVIRNHNEGRGQDILGTAFETKAEVVGLPDSRLHTLKAGAHKVLARLVTPPGSKTIEDMQRKRGQIEAALELPPGAVTVAIDEDHAAHALITVTDPRLMKKPIPWPGPSRPGASIAEPLRTGIYQDGDEVAYTILEHHLLTMGMTSSGKSFGGLWNVDAEAITRVDVAIWVADISKRTQTVGAFAPAIDWLAIEKKDALAMLDTVQAVIGPRTQHLAKKRLKGWEPGCGLTFLMVHLEEASDIFDVMTDKQIDKFVSTMRAARSAGIWLNISLQRAIWNQLDTNARAQFAGFMCFGVGSGDDTKYGLPEHVIDAGATPERWLSNRPGSYYLAAPGIPEAKQAIPARGYLISDEEMREHAAAWPASVRPLDEVTRRAAGEVYAGRTAAVTLVALAEQDEPGDTDPDGLADDVEQDDDEEVDPISEYQQTPDPDSSVTVDEDEEIEVPDDDEGFTFTQPAEKMTPDEAAAELLAQLAEWAEDERETFAPKDLRTVLERTGYKRGWIQKRLGQLVEDGVIDHGEVAGTYVILKAPARA